MTDFNTLERAAKRLCEQRHGAGSWNTKHRKRAAYRRMADRMLSLATADAFMAIFGLKRVAK